MSAPRKYIWTTALEADLRRIYAEHSISRVNLTEALRAFGLRLGWPVSALTTRARYLGITRFNKRIWTREEDLLLRELAGSMSAASIGRRLGRGWSSVTNRLNRLRMSAKITEGYSRVELCELFGNREHTVQRWIQSGWLRPHSETNRVSESQLRKFLEKHPVEYDLKRVDQAWFKGMIFPSFGSNAITMRGSDPHSPIEEVA